MRHSIGAAIRLSTVGIAVTAWALNTPATSADSFRELDLGAGPTTRLLVFAPHPDDEALGAAGLMQRVIAAGGSVRVVLMTSGDAFPEGVEAERHIRRPGPRDYRDYGNVRERETTGAMQLIGVNRPHMLFLGFPDGGLCLIASKYLSAKARAFESPYTHRIEPPASEQVIRGVTYRGIDVRREIERVLLAELPTLIVLPHPEDQHPDHCSTFIFVREALDAVTAWHHGFTPRILHYTIHYEQWPLSPGDGPALPLKPPPGFPAGEGEWRTFTLTPAEAALKRRVLADYPSQMLVIGQFLRAFGRSNELFIEGPPTSLPECWCDDTNVATEAPPTKYRRRPTPRR